jgi:Protein of unknown function (DUF3570)
MKKIFLTTAGLFALLQVFAQQKDSTGFQQRKLRVEEVNLVSSYYTQNGNNAAVTGGIGSQKLTDIANVFDVKLVKYDKKLRKHSFDMELGIDHYTSASSDKVDLKANSSASHADTRFYPSLTWTMENEKKGNSFSAGVSSSTEYDYQSFGGNVGYSKKTKNKNGEFSARLQVYLDQVKQILPTELRPGGGVGGDEDEHAGSKGRNTFAGSFSYSQIINQRLQVAFLADVVQQQGFLSLPFYRVYFNDGSVHQETLPDNRTKIPLGFRANYFLGDRFIVKAYYRYYTDSWGIRSHTMDLEVPVKFNAFLSVSPFYRYYTQTAVDYFKGYGQHTAQDNYYTSNYDLSKFNSSFFGAGIRFAPPQGVLNMQHFNMIELRYGHYAKNINMNSDIVSLNLRFK